MAWASEGGHHSAAAGTVDGDTAGSSRCGGQRSGSNTGVQRGVDAHQRPKRLGTRSTRVVRGGNH